MPASISASVGIHGGKQCYNVVRDQETIRDLLNAIPRSEGGAEGSLSGPISWGIASHALHSAILTFQRWQKLSVDGHIDPKGNAIRVMNRLVSGTGPTPTVGPSGPGGASGPAVVTRRCGPLRTVTRGMLPARVVVDGGPTGQFKFKRVSLPTKVNLDIASPASIKGTMSIILVAAAPAGPLWDVGMPSPVRWDIGAASVLPVGIEFEFLTDWAPGDPPCIPI